MPDIEPKHKKCTITIFYQGGTKARVGCVQDRITIEAEMIAARKESRDAKIECFEEDKDGKPTGEESYIYLSRNAMLMYNITVPLPEKVKGLVDVVSSIGVVK